MGFQGKNKKPLDEAAALAKLATCQKLPVPDEALKLVGDEVPVGFRPLMAIHAMGYSNGAIATMLGMEDGQVVGIVNKYGGMVQAAPMSVIDAFSLRLTKVTMNDRLAKMKKNAGGPSKKSEQLEELRTLSMVHNSIKGAVVQDKMADKAAGRKSAMDRALEMAGGRNAKEDGGDGKEGSEEGNV